MDANVVAKPPRTREEVIEALDRSFLWNGENAYFMYNDSGSIGEFLISADFPDEADRLFGEFENLLGMGRNRRDAFLDTFMQAREVWVHDSRDYLLREVFIPRLRRDVDEESGLAASELAAFEDEFGGDVVDHDALMSNLTLIGTDQGGFEELTPLSLYRAMVRGGAILSEEDFQRRYWRSWRVIEDEAMALSAKS